MAEKYLRPSFFIIGERKCGTSSLYRYLLDHPQILPCKIKEPQFFSRSLPYRLLRYRSYRALFPSARGRHPVTLKWFRWLPDGSLTTEDLVFERPQGRVVTGEASANTFARVPPRRLQRAMPGALFVLLLRHPVERAFSHYRMYQRFKQEGRKLPFELTDFATDSAREIATIQRGGRGYFVAPGMYDVHLKPWMDVAGSQLLVLRSEDLAVESSARVIMRDLCLRLRVAPHDFSKILTQQYNVTTSDAMPAEARERLQAFYTPHVRAVEQLLDRQMHWDE